MATEQPVPLQTDQVSNLPGAGIRTVVAAVPINGVMTPVQMQVIALADASGVVNDDVGQYRMDAAILSELRAIRSLLATIAQVPDLGIPPDQTGR